MSEYNWHSATSLIRQNSREFRIQICYGLPDALHVALYVTVFGTKWSQSYELIILLVLKNKRQNNIN